MFEQIAGFRDTLPWNGYQSLSGCLLYTCVRLSHAYTYINLSGSHLFLTCRIQDGRGQA
jgi:hypothetical protein